MWYLKRIKCKFQREISLQNILFVAETHFFILIKEPNKLENDKMA